MESVESADTITCRSVIGTAVARYASSVSWSAPLRFRSWSQIYVAVDSVKRLNDVVCSAG